MFSILSNFIPETWAIDYTLPNYNATFSATEDDIPSDILQQVSKMPEHSKHATFLNIEKKIHGFSGMYVDDTGKLNVYTTDNTMKSIDKSLLADYVDSANLAKGIIVKNSKHSWHKWITIPMLLDYWKK